MIYLASPYSHKDKDVMIKRFDLVCEIAAQMMKEGKVLFCPIAHTHPIAQYGLPLNWEYWEKYDRVMLSKCSEVVVVKMDGWETSKGVAGEIRIAGELGLPVSYIEPSGDI